MKLPTYVRRGDGQTAVFLLHGLGGGKAAWPWQLEALERGGYRAVAWDMPGYGESEAVAPYTLERLARALKGLIEHVGAGTNVLLGHSLGGMVAQEAYALYPEKIQGLILSATSPAFGKRDGAWQREFLERRLRPLDEGRAMRELAPELVRGIVGEGADPAGVELAIEVMAAVPADTYRAALAAVTHFDRRDLLPRIRVPTLLVAGALDREAPPSVMQKMAERIPSARYECLPEVGHLACMERPGQFNEAVLRFLAAYFGLTAPSSVAS
ncbi:MAG: alpha/beta fold hydrolase [candidate division NC10 bacterium]|nr:alpha/beta fold hydrolase [candidate division NC10 bacterium]MBI3086523.1 alpha/beta fold hydrolase [candidate division NC10 bacterium]